MPGDISPPPLKRIRLTTSADKREADDSGLTVYSWNVNGISPFIQQQPITSFFRRDTRDGDDADTAQDGKEPASLRGFLRRHAWPTVLFLQEVKINLEDTATKAAVEKAVRRQPNEDSGSPRYSVHFCLPSDKHNARGFGGKVYGVCSIIRDDFFRHSVAAVRPASWDKEGRFLIMETKATDYMPQLAIINVYAVNGTDNPYKDPQTGRPSGTRHDRKLEVHSLLQAECRRLQDEGFSCIVAGDLNIARTGMDGFPNLRTFPKQHCINRADFEARFISIGKEHSDDGSEAIPGLGMIDTFRHLHPDKRGYTFYPRTRGFGESCDRVDLILISKELEPFLKGAGMHETPAERGPSDHVPLFAQLDFERLSKEAI